MNLFNFVFYLQAQQMKEFAKWIILNMSVNEVLGKESGGLRKISKSHPLVFKQLLGTYTENFMMMTEK